ncbi:hypothetical protein [Lysinibacillus tabacifolii]|uniref:Uncharacterized protein n=1 Tax=Lysinibacillus tabacifolii TaxID=1173107 RepID=A0ABY2SW54_9BACI|nr:hypothetical protein [Lysinibacillus tabacifolii]TKI47543.1 hypothetical protein FC748_07725 [Lysinibacillus tabacifolii]
MLKNLEHQILSFNFKEAEALYHKSDFDQFQSQLISIAYDNGNMMNYTFLHYLLMKEESVELHNLALSLFICSLTPIEGAYHCALFHAERLVTLTNEQDPDTLEHLLFLNEVPDKLVSNEKALETCYKILALDPANKYAKETLKKLTKKNKTSLNVLQRKLKKKF